MEGGGGLFHCSLDGYLSWVPLPHLGLQPIVHGLQISNTSSLSGGRGDKIRSVVKVPPVPPTTTICTSNHHHLYLQPSNHHHLYLFCHLDQTGPGGTSTSTAVRASPSALLLLPCLSKLALGIGCCLSSQVELVWEQFIGPHG